MRLLYALCTKLTVANNSVEPEEREGPNKAAEDVSTKGRLNKRMVELRKKPAKNQRAVTMATR
jgi:hypothetical protein